MRGASEPVPARRSVASILDRGQKQHAELAADLVAAAYLPGDFVLSSGLRSTFYFDKYLFETKPGILRRVASLMAEMLPADVDRIAGTDLGSVPIAVAVSLETGVPFVILRSDDRQFGGTPGVEGELYPGERIVVVEDVVSSGTQATRSAERVASTGAQVEEILAVLDREQGGAQQVDAAGFRLRSLFRLSELPVPHA